MNRKTSLGLIGCGAFGRFILKSIAGLQEVNLAAVASRRRSSLDSALEVWNRARRESGLSTGSPQAFTDWADLIKSKRADIVIVATPPALHVPITRLALAAGSHVFVEKPGAVSSNEIETILKDQRLGINRVAVNFVMRFHPYYQFLRGLINSGTLGTVERMRVENEAHGDLPPNHWFWSEGQSGGILVEHGIHFLDLSLWLLGPARAVQTITVENEREGLIPDRVQATVLHGTGRPDQDTVVEHYHAFTRPLGLNRAETLLTFQKGYVRLQDWVPTSLELHALLDETSLAHIEKARPSGVMSLEATPLPASGCWESRGHGFAATHRVKLRLSRTDYEGQYRDCIRRSLLDLIGAMNDPATPLTAPIEAAAAALQLAEAAIKAGRIGRLIELDQGPVTATPFA